jgi:hypothetical protein
MEIIMQKAVSTHTRSLTGVSFTAARLATASAVLFLVLVVLLHFLKPELDPSWRMISEYAIGKYGWIMTVAFLLLAFSNLSLFVALKPDIRTIGGYIGLAILLVSAAGTILAAFNAMDPITAGPNEMTTHGNLHGLGAMLGIPTFPIAAVLISRSLAHNPAWSAQRRLLYGAAGLTWIGLVIMFGSLFIMLGQNGGKFGPDVMIGWPNRLLVITYCVWLITVGRLADRVH